MQLKNLHLEVYMFVIGYLCVTSIAWWC